MEPEGLEPSSDLGTIESNEQPASNSQDSPNIASTPEVTELDKLERFRFEGKDYTPSELKQHLLRQQDYTRKTQELARLRKEFETEQSKLSENQKYWSNLSADLEQLKADPRLITEFKKVYPKEFHSYASSILQSLGIQQKQEIPEELNERIAAIEQAEAVRNQEAMTAKLEAWSSEMGAKYPMAEEALVWAYLDMAAGQGKKVTKELVETYYKAAHEKIEARAKEHFTKTVNEQTTASKKARTIGSGGGVPGQAPKKLSFDEAANDTIKEFMR